MQLSDCVPVLRWLKQYFISKRKRCMFVYEQIKFKQAEEYVDALITLVKDGE